MCVLGFTYTYHSRQWWYKFQEPEFICELKPMLPSEYRLQALFFFKTSLLMDFVYELVFKCILVNVEWKKDELHSLVLRLRPIRSAAPFRTKRIVCFYTLESDKTGLQDFVLIGMMMFASAVSVYGDITEEPFYMVKKINKHQQTVFLILVWMWFFFLAWWNVGKTWNGLKCLGLLFPIQPRFFVQLQHFWNVLNKTCSLGR